MGNYVPSKGDFISITFDPQSGHEQKGRRPALVLSHYTFNKHTHVAIVCPITTTDRQIPVHLKIPTGMKLAGFVMVEQIKSIDFATRRAKFIEKAPSDLVENVLSLFDAFVN